MEFLAEGMEANWERDIMMTIRKLTYDTPADEWHTQLGSVLKHIHALTTLTALHAYLPLMLTWCNRHY